MGAFDTVDKLIVTDVYHACEKPINGINSANFVKDMHHKDCKYVAGDMETVARELYPELQSGDLVITLGAGTVTQVGKHLKHISEEQ